MKRFSLLFAFVCFVVLTGTAQVPPNDNVEIQKMTIDGTVVEAIIHDGDTLYIADLDDVSYTGIQEFKSNQERQKYMQTRHYAKKVFPYAVEAIKTYREVQKATETMSKRKRKKYVKKVQERMKDDFEEPLKRMSRVEGRILMAMIERELEVPMYDVVKELRGGFNAFYWTQLGRTYGYKLKKGYDPTEDPVLDAVLSDFDISYDPRKIGK